MKNGTFIFWLFDLFKKKEEKKKKKIWMFVFPVNGIFLIV